MDKVQIYRLSQRKNLGLARVAFAEGATKGIELFPAMLIGMLGTCKRYQGKGLAKHMVKAAIGEARALSEQAGCRFVIVDADPTEKALGLYQSLNFVKVEGQDKKRRTMLPRLADRSIGVR